MHNLNIDESAAQALALPIFFCPDVLHACQSRNALLAYITLALREQTFAPHEAVPIVTNEAHLSRSAAYRALNELCILGLVERAVRGYRVCVQPNVTPLPRPVSNNLRRAKGDCR